MGLLSQRGWILWETQVRGHSSLWWAFLIDIEISLHLVKRNFVLQALIQRKLSLSLQHTVTLSVRCFYLEEALRVFFGFFLQDLDTSNTLEVCCCRDESIDSSCRAVCGHF